MLLLLLLVLTRVPLSVDANAADDIAVVDAILFGRRIALIPLDATYYCRVGWFLSFFFHIFFCGKTKSFFLLSLLYAATTGDLTALKRFRHSAAAAASVEDMKAANYDGRTALHLVNAVKSRKIIVSPPHKESSSIFLKKIDLGKV